MIVLTESGKVFGWGQGIIDQTNDEKEQNYEKSSVVEIKSFDIHNLEEVQSWHRFLLKFKTPLIEKPKQYYSSKFYKYFKLRYYRSW